MNIYRVFFLRQWVQCVGPSFLGSTLTDAYYLPGGDMIITLNNQVHIKVVFFSDLFLFAYFPYAFTKPSVFKPCLTSFHGKRITRMEQCAYDRSFFMLFENKRSLFFTFFGRRSNIIGFDTMGGSSPVKPELARPHLVSDLDWTPHQLQHAGLANVTFPLQSSSLAYMFSNQKNLLPVVIIEHEQGLADFFNHVAQAFVWDVRDDQMDVELRPFNPAIGDIQSSQEVNEILQNVFLSYVKKRQLKERKDAVLKTLQSKCNKYRKDLLATENAYHQMINARPMSEVADIIMAHLHEIQPSHEEKTHHLFDFYRQSTIEVNIPANKNAVDFAAALYRKGKNKHLEIHMLKDKVVRLKQELHAIEQQIQQTEEATTHKVLQRQQKGIKIEDNPLPYKKFVIEGYEIRVGKSAKHNDELLRSYSSKHDLWMHAKDYAGSHLILRLPKNGSRPPAHVIEKAAAIAGWYSKGKSQPLLPVMVTERKYVRKGKKLKPGQVIVEREEVILVQPALRED